MYALDIDLTSCKLCPRKCGVNRIISELGYCNTDAKPLVASITVHKGEEPVLSGSKGICNVFFAHCNLRCVFCQNRQISRTTNTKKDWLTSFDEIIEKIAAILDQGINILGFVSPTHQVPQMIEIVERLNQKGYTPRVVYNTNGYDSPTTLGILNDYVDIYIPDIKYFDDKLALKYSDAQNYFTIAAQAIKEMIWQKGTNLTLNNEGLAESGVIVRHLIIPNHSADSIRVLQELSDISTNITISLMSQYHPMNSCYPDIERCITKNEYEAVISEMNSLGFHRGWIQNMDSNAYYLPNFNESSPFKK